MQILEIPFQQKNIFVNGVSGLGFMGNQNRIFFIKKFLTKYGKKWRGASHYDPGQTGSGSERSVLVWNRKIIQWAY
jgi:hypothetical protein